MWHYMLLKIHMMRTCLLCGVMKDTFFQENFGQEEKSEGDFVYLYPLVTHDPNMLKKSHEGTDLGKLKCLFQKEIRKFPVETVYSSTQGSTIT